MLAFCRVWLLASVWACSANQSLAEKPPQPLTIPLDFKKVPIVLTADKEVKAKDLRVDIIANRTLLPIEEKGKNDRAIFQDLKLGDLKYYPMPVYEELKDFERQNDEKRISATLRFRVVEFRGRAYCEIMPEYRLPIDLKRHPLRVFDGKKRAQEIQRLRVAANNAEVALPGIQSKIIDLDYALRNQLANAASAEKEETRRYYLSLAESTRQSIFRAESAEEEARYLRSIRGDIEKVARDFEQFAGKIRLMAITAKLTIRFHSNGKTLAIYKRSSRTKLPEVGE